MDLHTPMNPEQFSHLRVSTMRRSPHTLVCCVCHARAITGQRNYLCDQTACRLAARQLGWLR